jgi:hypothetical protein
MRVSIESIGGNHHCPMSHVEIYVSTYRMNGATAAEDAKIATTMATTTAAHIFVPVHCNTCKGRGVCWDAKIQVEADGCHGSSLMANGLCQMSFDVLLAAVNLDWLRLFIVSR